MPENQSSELYQDRQINCKDCKQPFTFTARDQAFYARQSFSDPKRCKNCRLLNKQKIARHQEALENESY